MLLNHKIKVERRAVENILASVVGGCFVGAYVHWWLALVGSLVAVALFIEEKAEIEEER